MSIPDSLQQRLTMFQENGHLLAYRQGLFQPPSWLAVMLGQGVTPRHCDLRLSRQNADLYQQSLANYQQQLQQLVGRMPSHQSSLQAQPAHNTFGETAAGETAASPSIYGSRRSACNH